MSHKTGRHRDVQRRPSACFHAAPARLVGVGEAPGDACSAPGSPWQLRGKPRLLWLSGTTRHLRRRASGREPEGEPRLGAPAGQGRRGGGSGLGPGNHLPPVPGAHASSCWGDSEARVTSGLHERRPYEPLGTSPAWRAAQQTACPERDGGSSRVSLGRAEPVPPQRGGPGAGWRLRLPFRAQFSSRSSGLGSAVAQGPLSPHDDQQGPSMGSDITAPRAAPSHRPAGFLVCSEHVSRIP